MQPPQQLAGDAAQVIAEDVQKAKEAYDGDTDLQDLCEANGISEEDFLHGRRHVHYLEMFLTEFLSLNSLRWFPCIRELHLIHCGLTELGQGLSSCTALEQLWVNENELTSLRGLEGCTALRELYAYSNNLSGKVEGLESLQNLQVLWLMENHISTLDGLTGLTTLRCLSLASNQIDTLAPLETLTSLEELNLAGNRLSSLREIPLLNRLPRLCSVTLDDPHFGDNPVCRLYNYSTFTIYHLARVTKLDSLVISEESRQMAETTFIKKKMYYNMRIKTLKRNANNLVQHASQFHRGRVSEIGRSLTAMTKTVKALERVLAEQLHYGVGGGEQMNADAVRKKLQDVDERIRRDLEDIQALGQCFETMRELVQSTTAHNISRLMTELETGGNVRLEEGKPSEVWFKSCVDLVRSRFFSTDFAGVAALRDVKVVKVVRLHHRHLRNLFDARVAAWSPDSGDASAARPPVEYLFHSEPLTLPGELLRVVEHGFREPQDYEQLGLGSGVTLHSSMFMVDHQRLMNRQTSQPGTTSQRGGNVFYGRLVVAKVFVGTCVAEKEPEPTGPRGETPPVLRQEYPDRTDCVLRVSRVEQRHSVWTVLQPQLALPEYVVEYTYVPAELLVASGASASPQLYSDLADIPAAMQKLVPSKSEIDSADLRSFAFD
eukprot:RCo041993